MFRRNFRKSIFSKRTHRATGQSLVETLIALLICALISTVLSDTLGRFLSFSTGSERQLIARELAQQILDNARNQTWTQLQAGVANQGGASYTLLTNKYGGEVGPAISPRPLHLDKQNLSWTDQSSTNMFRGTCRLALAYVPGSTTEINATATINWGDSRGPHSLTASTVISQFGIHN